MCLKFLQWWLAFQAVVNDVWAASQVHLLALFAFNQVKCLILELTKACVIYLHSLMVQLDCSCLVLVSVSLFQQ